MEKRRRHKNPIRFIDPPRRRHKDPRNLSAGELGLLLSYPHEPRIKAALLFLADTGARLGELYNVCPSDFKKTPDGYVVTICGKTGQRTVPVSLATFLSLKDQLPFPYQLHRLGEKLSMAFKSVGVQGTAHSLRHTFATLWDGDELVLQRITGHAHLETLKIYRHLRMPALCEQHKKHGPLRRALARKLPKGML